MTKNVIYTQIDDNKTIDDFKKDISDGTFKIPVLHAGDVLPIDFIMVTKNVGNQGGMKAYLVGNDLEDGSKNTKKKLKTVEFDLANHGMELTMPDQKEGVVAFPDNVYNAYMDKFKGKKATVSKSEIEFLQTLIANATANNLVYSEQDLVNFHVALKSSNLVVLAGMSGTGKSRLAKLYAETCLLDDEHFKMIPVSPSWTDEADIMGYLDQKNMLYKPADTGLLDLLVAAEEHPDELYIVCFDEMNLARVEYYFSQFISVLENTAEKRYIHLYNEKQNVYNSNIYPAKVKVGSNVRFIGTVNIDESTFHLTDKVLDRASVIELAACDFSKLKYVGKEKPIKYVLSKDDFYNGSENCEFNLTDREVQFLTVLNQKLAQQNPRLGIGYRIINQINQYLEALPQGYSKYNRKQALDDLVEQRILTKIRGSQEQLGNLLPSGQDVKGDLIETLDAYEDLSNFEKSVTVLAKKGKELKSNGYTV